MQVTLDDRSSEVLLALAEEEHKPAEALIAELIEARRRESFIKRVNARVR